MVPFLRNDRGTPLEEYRPCSQRWADYIRLHIDSFKRRRPWVHFKDALRPLLPDTLAHVWVPNFLICGSEDLGRVVRQILETKFKGQQHQLLLSPCVDLARVLKRRLRLGQNYLQQLETATEASLCERLGTSTPKPMRSLGMLQDF